MTGVGESMEIDNAAASVSYDVLRWSVKPNLRLSRLTASDCCTAGHRDYDRWKSDLRGSHKLRRNYLLAVPRLLERAPTSSRVLMTSRPLDYNVTHQIMRGPQLAVCIAGRQR